MIQVPRRVLMEVGAQPWAIEEGKGAAIWSLLEARSRGEPGTDEQIAAVVQGRRERRAGQSGGVMVLPVFGVISHRMSALEASSGGESVERLAARFDAAVDNPGIGTIVMQIDSPGGSVYGIAELAERIHAARGKKRIIAVADPLMASAAYWLGSAADEVVVTPSGQVGSIGVVSVHAEFSRKAEAEGVTFTLVRSGRYKAEASPYEPLSKKAVAHLQQTSDDYYGRFVAAVAKHRGVDESRVRNGMGEGRVLTADRAVSAGLADRVATLEQVLADLGVSLTQDGPRAEAPEFAEILPAAFDGVSVVSCAELVMHQDSHAAELLAALEAAETARRTPKPLQPQGTEPNQNQPADVDVDATAHEGAPTTTEAPSGQEAIMPDTGTRPQDGAPKADTTVQVTRDESAVRRADEIIGLCKELGVPHRITDFVNGPMTTAQVSESLRAEAEQKLEAMRAPAVDLTEREQKRYSITRAIMAVAEQGEGWSGFEREVSDSIRANLPKDVKSHGGIFVPTRFQAALDSATSTAGEELVFTEAGDFIDLLRARMKVAQLGATILTGLQGPVAFPKQDGAGTFTWVAEDPGSDLSDSDMTLTQVALNPKAGQSSTAYSRQLLAQGVVDVDTLVKNDLALITALGIDLAAIAGTGLSNQPTGVLNTSNIGDVAIGATGGAPAYTHMVDLETDVATANADIGAMAYLTTPGVRGKLKKTEEFATSNGRPVWTGGMEGEVNGYPAHVSTQVPSNLTKSSATGLHAVIFGVWSQLMIGYWGAYELVVDPYSKKKQGLIELTSFQMAGVAVRHPEAFSAIQDANPSA